MSEKKISTTQLAKRLNLESREVFELLSAAKWIDRQSTSENDGPAPKTSRQAEEKPRQQKWRLTAKGEFEQGEYYKSDKFGTYIVWPVSIVEHRLFKELDDKLLNATQLGKLVKQPGRLINNLLLEMGYIDQHIEGWVVTPVGQSVGGVDKEHEKSGFRYVVWPESLVLNTEFSSKLDALSLLPVDLASKNEASEIKAKPSVKQGSGFQCLDGHVHDDRALMVIDNWLYIARQLHACHKPLSAKIDSDFYLPKGNVYIEYWGRSNSPEMLSEKLQKLEYYETNKLKCIELTESDIHNIDEKLTKSLLKFGVKVY